MSRHLTPGSSIEQLKKEAKRWLKALRSGDPQARARLERSHSDAPSDPTLRDVQHALAREHGFPGWSALKEELARRAAAAPIASREEAVTALLTAALRGDVGQVGDVLHLFPDVVDERAELPGHSGRRGALHYAMAAGHAEVIDALLARGADPDLRDEGDNAAVLHFAAERGELGIVRTLVEHGADPVGADDLHELEVIGWATCFPGVFHRDVAEYLLAHGARHTIFSAAAMGDTDAVCALAARAPADLDRPMDRTNHRRRPLHLAILKQQPGSLATLLELGADVEATDAAGLTPLDQAALSGEVEMAERLLGHGARLGVPAAAALERHEELERLLQGEPDCLRPGGRWARLIVRAAAHSSGRVVETLIRHGASVNVRDDHVTAVDQTHGFTALHAAATEGNAEAARVLLRHGADPCVREDRYWGTPLGWADYFGRAEVRDVIADGPIDIFDALVFDRPERVAEILARDPEALERRLRDHVNGDPASRPWLDVEWTPVAFAAAHGKAAGVRLLAERGADLSVRDSKGRTLLDLAREGGHEELAAYLESRASEDRHEQPVPEGGFEATVADFLRMACLDWRTGGPERAFRAADAARLLEREPAIARANLYTAAVCGDVQEVRRILGERPGAANEIGGPRGWPPLLYLCSARLPLPEPGDNAPAVARLLLDRGADPNAFYLGGNADIHYTALTCVLGRGEELASMHPRARELAALLLEAGADPHDNQVLYNVFADNTSRHLLGDDIVWLLDLMHEHSVRRGHGDLWKDPSWPMFDMRGAPSLGHQGRVHRGARFLLDAAVERNLLGMAAWLLEHGAGPNTPRE